MSEEFRTVTKDEFWAWVKCTTRNVHPRSDSLDVAGRMSRSTRLLLRLFARRLNRDVFYPVLGRAYERGLIRSREFHELHAEFDPTQPGVVGFASGQVAAGSSGVGEG